MPLIGPRILLKKRDESRVGEAKHVLLGSEQC